MFGTKRDEVETGGYYVMRNCFLYRSLGG